jgi:hypothetical protein
VRTSFQKINLINVRSIVSATNTKGNMLVRTKKFPEIGALLNRSDEKGPFG